MKTLALLATLALSFNAISAINTSYFASLDVKAIHDEEIQNEVKGEAPRFAIAHQVSVNPAKSMDWEKSGNTYSWSHRVSAPNAVSLNFGFTQYNLPEGATLDIYSADRSEYIRTFTSEDNNVNNQLWTPVIMSDDVVIELNVPASQINEVALELGHVGQGFRTFAQPTKKSGSCNIDVACTESRGWESEINTVGVISTGGSTFCTGFMVNNVKNDKTPLFMTAAHCRISSSSAPSLVVYWNYQKSQCRGPADGKKTDFQSGSVHLASYAASDFTIVKLNSQPKPEWNVKYAGFNAAADSHGTPVVAIHHPNVDEKSISWENDPSALSSYGGTSSPGNSTHIWVKDWDKGTTEPGSSGSPLFDSNHRVIGQLHGGGAACGNDLPDYYGRLYTSWIGGGTASTRLKDHLDPDNTGVMQADTI